jgi:hypothetical protein
VLILSRLIAVFLFLVFMLVALNDVFCALSIVDGTTLGD